MKESICLCKLTLAGVKNFILKVLKEIPDSLTRIYNNRTCDDKLINLPLFRRYQMRHLGKKVSGSPCRCSGCLRPRCIQNKSLPLYVQGLFILKEHRILDTKTQNLLICSSCDQYFKFLQQHVHIINQFFLTQSLREEQL